MPKAQTPDSAAPNRAARRARKKPAEVGLDSQVTLKCSGRELAFLRLLLTNATVQPSELKILNGELLQKVEAIIGPLPQQQ